MITEPEKDGEAPVESDDVKDSVIIELEIDGEAPVEPEVDGEAPVESDGEKDAICVTDVDSENDADAEVDWVTEPLSDTDILAVPETVEVGVGATEAPLTTSV